MTSALPLGLRDQLAILLFSTTALPFPVLVANTSQATKNFAELCRTICTRINGVTTVKYGEERHTHRHFLSSRELPEIGYANVTWQNTIPPFRSNRETPPVGRCCWASLTCFQST